MQKEGFKCIGKRCKNKWDIILSKYKKVREQNVGTCNESYWDLSFVDKNAKGLPGVFDWYEILKSFMGQRLCMTLASIADSNLMSDIVDENEEADLVERSILAMHYKWVVDLVTMPTGVWQMRYLILAWEDLSNQVEGRALRTKSTEVVCRFLLEEVVCRYGCVGKITADRGELDTHAAREFFEKCGVKLALTTAYNPEGNAKSERGHPPIVKAIVKACRGKASDWPRFLPYALWADRTTHKNAIFQVDAMWDKQFS